MTEENRLGARLKSVAIACLVAALTGWAAAGEIVLNGPSLDFVPNVSGMFDIWLKWGDFAGHEDARFEVEHAGGVAGYALSQDHNPGWHFLGAYHLDRASRILATNRSATNQPHLRKPVGIDAVKLVPSAPRVLVRTASELVTVVELDVGDELRLVCRDGRTRSLRLVGTGARPTKREGLAITEFSFTQDYAIDGKRKSFTCIVPSSDFMCRPIETDGLLLWPDSVQDIFADCGGFEIEKDFRHVAGTCRPMRRARLMVQDAAIGRICPEKCHWWYPERYWPQVPEQCYMGRDCWMGTWYQTRTFPSERGNEVHCGLDINMPHSTPLVTPFALDEQHYFHSVRAGNNNNRWRGIRRWNRETTWWIQSHHIDVPYVVPEGGPLGAQVRYALSGGQAAGEFTHTHFNLRTFRYGTAADGQRTEEAVWVNPGVLFWQMQQDSPLPSRPATRDVVADLAFPAMAALTVKGAKGVEGELRTTKRGAMAFFKFLPKKMFGVGLEFGFGEWKVELRETLGGWAAEGVLEKDGERAFFAMRFNAGRRYLGTLREGVAYAPVFDLANGAPFHAKVGFGKTAEDAAKVADSLDWCYERFNR